MKHEQTKEQMDERERKDVEGDKRTASFLRREPSRGSTLAHREWVQANDSLSLDKLAAELNARA